VPSKLRILHLIDKNRLTTGSVVQMMEAARELSRRGHRVAVGSSPGGDLEDACTESGVGFLGLRFRGPRSWPAIRKLRRYLRTQETELLHVHKGRAHAAALAAAAGLGRNPRLVVNRGVVFRLDAFNKWKYHHPRVRAVVCVADAVREVVIESAALDPSIVHTVYGGTDVKAFDPTRTSRKPTRSELGFDSEHVVIGQVSVRDWKGWAELIEAFARVRSNRPEARLLLIGCEGPHERSKIETVARAAGVIDQVVILPYRTDMADVLAACDVVVDASFAGTGITGTIREAMALERAVVATDCGGNRELVIDGDVGLVVPPRDTDALASALIRLTENPSLRRELGSSARIRVVDQFSTEQRVDRLEALYRKILE
jgi:glycosyltransferase involved in cell wall biosynthesis